MTIPQAEGYIIANYRRYLVKNHQEQASKPQQAEYLYRF